MKIETPSDEFINQEVPQLDRSLFPKSISAAYEAVTELVSATPFLQCPTSKLAQGHLIAWAVDFAVSQLIESGQWKVEGYDWEWFQKPTGKYLRIFTKKAVLTVSQISDTDHQPRNAGFRSNAAFDNQRVLFYLPGEVNLNEVRRPHLLLIHGYHNLDFIHVAMPNPEKRPAWLGMSPNALQELHDISADLTPAEGPSQITPITIKEALRKEIHDHGK